MVKYAIIVHGGATEEKYVYENCKEDIDKIIEYGKKLIEERKSALEITREICVKLEDCPILNAGKGAVLTNTKKHELDSCIMNGENKHYGAVTGVTRVKNPVLLAYELMKEHKTKYISGSQTTKLSKKYKLPIVPNSYYSTDYRIEEQKNYKKKTKHSKGTVGVVVRDNKGHICSATSTGGLCNKMEGRVADSSIIGASTYAVDDIGGISTTGNGEVFIQFCVANSIVLKTKYTSTSLEQSAKDIMSELPKNSGAVIGIDKENDPFVISNREFAITGMYVEN